MDTNALLMLPGIENEELLFLQNLLRELSDEQQRHFLMLYQGRRKDPQTILICTLLGFFGVAGIQRFILNQAGMGILYLFTYGICLVGTIIDLVNYRKMTWEFNQRAAVEAAGMTRALVNR
ncbi:TM2 domain-containing protein [Compostibacter hankyongensis]|uniref:TM2 domain-containing protein n=1 Tax=Compostibacter hankyongensis TaxID=1007089 RepID=A0ABP8G571_9BACT